MKESFFVDLKAFDAVENNDKDTIKGMLCDSFCIENQFLQRGYSGKADHLHRSNSLIVYLYKKAFGESLFEV